LIHITPPYSPYLKGRIERQSEGESLSSADECLQPPLDVRGGRGRYVDKKSILNITPPHLPLPQGEGKKIDDTPPFLFPLPLGGEDAFNYYSPPSEGRGKGRV
jgi:hypothetical protein